MGIVRNAAARAAIMFALVLPAEAGAIELTGAWATDADRCDKVFVRKGRGDQISFAQFPGVYGGGFIVDADRLRGKHVNCSIKSRKEDGQTLNLIAGCASDIMLSNVQFVLKIVDDNTISRVFPGMEGMEVTYHRCKL